MSADIVQLEIAQLKLRAAKVRATAAAVLVALAMAAPASAGALGGKLANIHIDNFGQVNDHYFRGGQPKTHDYADLAAAGVKTVINLIDGADPNERALVEAAGMRYVAIPMTTHVVPTPTQIAEFLKDVADPSNQPVFVHCIGGRHRTGVMTAIYRMSVEGWDSARAFAEMKTFKFGADFLHPEFKDFVLAYRPALAAAAPAQGAAPTPRGRR
jgi:tyrosine-protein phosphatase SIW14